MHLPFYHKARPLDQAAHNPVHGGEFLVDVAVHPLGKSGTCLLPGAGDEPLYLHLIIARIEGIDYVPQTEFPLSSASQPCSAVRSASRSRAGGAGLSG